MKLILIFLISFISITAQIKVVGDTTDLKNTYGSGVVLLEQYGRGDINGGGFFHRIDSAYSEGTFAFSYPTDNCQAVRMNLVDYYLNISTANYQIPVWITDRYTALDIAGIDSFYTTNTLDTIRIPGLDTASVFVFAEYTPLYSTAIDTMIFSYRCKTDTVFVSRSSPNNTADYKSGGQYSYMRLR